MTRGAASGGPGIPQATGLVERAQGRIELLEEKQGWSDRPTYFLQVLAPDATELAGFYDDLRGALTNHQILRQDGFSPWQNSDITVLEGGWLTHRPDIITLIEPDGLLTHGLLASENTYLGWYYNDHRAEGAPLILHPIAVVEITLEFFRFFHTQIRPRSDGRPWRHRISCRRFRSNNLALPAGHPMQRRAFYNLPVASADEWTSLPTETSSAGRDAFEDLQRFYMLFGHTAAAIPLVDNGAVSEAALLALP